MSDKIYKIIILGPQGSGKGTQAEFLAEKLSIPNISIGQLLRQEVKKQSKTGQEIDEYMKKGELVPNSIAHELAKARIEQDDCQNGFIFDGFPRILIQAKFLDTITSITDVLEITLSDEEAIRRLSGRRTCPQCGKIYHLEYNPPKNDNVCDVDGESLVIRADDTEAAIRERLKIYHTETTEVVSYYADKGILIKVNGEPAIEEVKEEIFRSLSLS
jgi:adenylate kinase